MTSSDYTSVLDSGNVQVIEWNMLDKQKFVPLSIVSALTVRALIYPLAVIKTRIQVQPKSGIYRGTFHGLWHIFRYEGLSGLYRGYLVSALQSGSTIVYVSSYEKVRHALLTNFNIRDNSVRAFISGSFASAASQLILVPFDIVSQHMMVLERMKPAKRQPTVGGNFSTVSTQVADTLDSLNLRQKLEQNPKSRLVPLICMEIYRRDGIFRGFYRGYFASLMSYGPSSGLFWFLYQLYNERIFKVVPDKFPHLAIHAMSAPLTGASVAIMTNPLDLFRSNLQVHGLGWGETFRRLKNEEGLAIFTKGLGPRLLLLPISSSLFVCGYEVIKRLSVHSDIKHKVQW